MTKFSQRMKIILALCIFVHLSIGGTERRGKTYLVEMKDKEVHSPYSGVTQDGKSNKINGKTYLIDVKDKEGQSDHKKDSQELTNDQTGGKSTENNENEVPSEHKNGGLTDNTMPDLSSNNNSLPSASSEAVDLDPSMEVTDHIVPYAKNHTVSKEEADGHLDKSGGKSVHQHQGYGKAPDLNESSSPAPPETMEPVQDLDSDTESKLVSEEEEADSQLDKPEETRDEKHQVDDQMPDLNNSSLPPTPPEAEKPVEQADTETESRLDSEDNADSSSSGPDTSVDEKMGDSNSSSATARPQETGKSVEDLDSGTEASSVTEAEADSKSVTKYGTPAKNRPIEGRMPTNETEKEVVSKTEITSVANEADSHKKPDGTPAEEQEEFPVNEQVVKALMDTSEFYTYFTKKECVEQCDAANECQGIFPKKPEGINICVKAGDYEKFLRFIDRLVETMMIDPPKEWKEWHEKQRKRKQAEMLERRQAKKRKQRHPEI